MPRAPRQLPSLPPPNRAIQKPGANSPLDKIWGARSMGIALGGSGIVIAEIATAGGRNFYGYGVFEMIPSPTSDKDDKSKQRYQAIASDKSTGIGDDSYYAYRSNLYDSH